MQELITVKLPFTEVKLKKIIAVFLLCSMLFTVLSPYVASAKLLDTLAEKEGEVVTVSGTDTQLNLSSPSAVLIEGSSGTIIYEKNKDERLKPASITKIMTLLLIFEALDAGQIKLTDEVSVSEYAASMGGSQVYL